jgi:hypothetical protein
VERHSSYVRAAYLVRKQLPGYDRAPLYVLGIERHTFLHESAARSARLLLERITKTPGLPSGVLVCVVTRANRGLLAKWKALPDSLLVPSQRPVPTTPAPQVVRPRAPIMEHAGRASLTAPTSQAAMK